MKGELLRKRYFLLSLKQNWSEVDALEKDLYRTFKARSRFKSYPHLIILTDQFQKDFLSKYIERHYPSVEIVSVSGTIKKLKEKM